jgi:hypothetical protein
MLFVKTYKEIKEDQNKELIKNMEEYAKKEKIKQQKSKVLVKRKITKTRNKKESINVYS